jgi:hypothetical protein
MDLIVSLYGVQCLRQESDRVPCIVVDLLLGEDCTGSDPGAIGLESEW